MIHRSFRPTLQALDSRDLPSADLYIDFGTAFPTGGLMMDDGRAILVNGPTVFEDGLQLPGLAAAVKSQGRDYNGDFVSDAQDVKLLADAVIADVQRTYEPFDVTVTTAAAHDFTDIMSRLGASSTHDAYIVVGGDPHPDYDAYGWSLVDEGNGADNTGFVFANALLADLAPSLASDATALARVIAHEAGHSFGLEHTLAWEPYPTTVGDEMGAPIFEGFPESFDTRSFDEVNLFTRYVQPTVGGSQNAFYRLLFNVGLKPDGYGYVTGTGANDQIEIQITASDSGTAAVTPYTDSDYTALAGLPTKYPISASGPVTVEAGHGDDEIIVTATPFLTTTTVRGGAGTDALIIRGTEVVDAITVFHDHVVINGATVWYSEVESVRIEALGGADTITVEGTTVGVAVSVLAGADNDRITVGGSDGTPFRSLTNVKGELSLDGGGFKQGDRIVFDDQGKPGPGAQSPIYTLGGDALTRSAAGMIRYTNTDMVDLRTTSDNDTVIVTDLNYATTYTLRSFGGSDTLQGPDDLNTWVVTGANAGKLNGRLTFVDVERLVGGSRADQFVMKPGGSVSGGIDGKGGSHNLLDYHDRTLIGVYVNLFTGTATGIGTVAGIQDVYGSQSSDVLVGSDGINELWGIGGRDLVIGRGGADRVSGGLGQDIVIGGSTRYDRNKANLQALLAEWNSKFPAGTRVKHLRSGGGANGRVLLNATTIIDDLAGDTINGDNGPGSGYLFADWLLAGHGDKTPDCFYLIDQKN